MIGADAVRNSEDLWWRANDDTMDDDFIAILRLCAVRCGAASASATLWCDDVVVFSDAVVYHTVHTIKCAIIAIKIAVIVNDRKIPLVKIPGSKMIDKITIIFLSHNCSENDCNQLNDSDHFH